MIWLILYGLGDRCGGRVDLGPAKDSRYVGLRRPGGFLGFRQWNRSILYGLGNRWRACRGDATAGGRVVVGMWDGGGVGRLVSKLSRMELLVSVWA